MGKIYTKQAILERIDHTLLSPTATAEEFAKLFAEAIRMQASRIGVAAVCIPPGWVEVGRSILSKEVKICTVIGFPFGYDDAVAKMNAAKQAIDSGADEIDMVIDIGKFKSKYTDTALFYEDWDMTSHEIQLMRRACPENVILKVIVEACYLNEQQKIDICKIVTDAGADYIKTSTGFGPGGATLEDVKLFREHIGPNVKIKAAGGIATIEDTLRFLEAGADRIGSSKVVPLLLADERMEFSLD